MSYFGNLWEAIRGYRITVGTDKMLEGEYNGIFTGNTFDLYSHSSQIAVVYTCCKILADSVSRLNLDIFQTNSDNSETKDIKDPRYNLLSYQPNNYQNSQKFWSAIEYNRNLHGNSFAKIERNWGRPISLKILKPSRFLGYSIKDNRLYYKFLENDKEKVYDASEILHFTNVSNDGIVGVSPLTAMRLSLSVNYKAYTTIDKTYQHGLKSSKALKYPYIAAPNSKKQEEQLEKFQEEFAGYAKADKVALLPKGADLIDLQINPKDAEFLGTIAFTTKDIASAFRVPVHMLNILESTKFNSVEAMQLAFVNNELGSILKMYRDELEFKLLDLEERKAGKTYPSG